MKDFFIDKFEFDFESNRIWTENLMNNEDELTPFILNSMSHIINVHHIWNMRLLQETPESGIWDSLPIDFFNKFHFNNYQTTINFLENHEIEEKINYHDSEGVPLEKFSIDILYHILNHSNYHRGQINLELKHLNISPSISNFIFFK
jgi:uncharacterized damage-inducible protein DinB